MKDKNIIDKTMHFLVHNSFMFTIVIMCLVHLTLLALMYFEKVTPLVQVNIMSVIVYLFCIVLSRFGHIMPVYVSLILEVSVYVIASCHYIGWKCGSVCFLCAIVPIIIYFGCFLFKGKQRWIIVFLLLANYAMYVTLYVRLADVKPIFEVSDIIQKILMIFSSFVMIFSVIVYSVIYIYSSEYQMVSLEEKNQKLSVDAKEDALTSLLNRRGFLPVVESLMKGDTPTHFCVSFCDIDNFKRINDSYGHDCGDEVLRHITWIIKKEMHGCDICRWGGEEIIILMKDYDMAVAREKMEYLRKCIESNPTVFFNRRVEATITIGLAEYEDIFKEPDDIIKKADERMYYGKQHGKNILIYEDAV